MSKLYLIKEFIKNPGKVGTIYPSSHGLAEAMIANLQLEKAPSVIELGPGSGAITNLILEKLQPDAKFFMVELNSNFHDQLIEKYPNITIYNESAERLDEFLKLEGLQSVDVIISGLPWTFFPEELQVSLLDQICAALSDNGYFSTYAYLHGRILPGGRSLKKELNARFSKVETSSIVWKNVPPAFVYQCRK